MRTLRTHQFKSVIHGLQVLLLLAVPVLLGQTTVTAAQMMNRSIAIASPQASLVTSHSFSFNGLSAGIVGSIKFEYCSNSPLFGQSCTAPPGLSASSATLFSQSGNTGFVVDLSKGSVNSVVLARVPVNASAGMNNYVLGNITNPSAAPQTVFVRISTYVSNDSTGGYTDYGSVAFSTETGFSVGAYVPPFLRHCVGITVSSNCAQSTGTQINLGELEKSRANTATSQFATATNDPTGCVIYSLGSTMTSGNNVIPAITSSGSVPGTSQFGINLRQNINPSVGNDPAGGGTVFPTGSYNTPNLFTFLAGDSIANSPLPTDYTVMTVSYLVNVSKDQAPGSYATTLTYLAVVSF